MAPKKKKKASANPARGFATTSLPSRSKVVEEAEQAHPDPSIPTDNLEAAVTHIKNENGLDNATQNASLSKKPTNIQEMTPDQLEAHLENAELEDLIEKHATRCIAEANRQASKLEAEKRQLRPQATKVATYSWLSDDIINDLFDMNEKSSTVGFSSAGVKITFDETERLLLDLWTLQRVLQALNFPDVHLAITHIAHLAASAHINASSDLLPGLLESLEWYALNYQTGELPDYAHDTPRKQPLNGDSTASQEKSEPPSNSESTQSPAPMSERASEGEEESASMSSSESDEDNDPTQLIDKYVRFQSQIWEAQNLDLGKSETTLRRKKRVARLNQKVQHLQRDILFDEHAAESKWSLECIDLQSHHQQHLRIQAVKRREGSKRSPAQSEDVIEDEVRSTAHSLASEDDDELLGGMFEAVENGVSSASTDKGGNDQVQIVDFGSWTGVSPRKLLEDISKGHDPKCRIQTSFVHSTAYSTRHKLTISWSTDTSLTADAVDALPSEVISKVSPRAWDLEMKNIAATTKVQSEAYVASLALFLMSTLGTKEHKATSRLPTKWRDLIKELSETKQKIVIQEHKIALREIRSIISTTQNTMEPEDNKSIPKFSRKLVDCNERERSKRSFALRFNAEQVAHEWAARISRPAFEKMLEVRRQLPVHSYKDAILECIKMNPVTVICAETGAGKSSGIPVLLLEQDFSTGKDCRILVTQPRRISAVTLARRVSQELGESKNDVGTARSLVGYAIRLESKTSSSTRITYATTGVLLRMLEESPDLNELDFLILDEVHERTMDLDLLFIALKKLQERRKSLKIILMSATVDAKKFSSYFGDAPVLDLPGRTFPVEVGFLEDAIEATNDLTSFKDKGLQIENEILDIGDSVNEKGRPTILNPDTYSKKTQQTIAGIDEYRIDYSLLAKVAVAIATKPEYKKYSSAILIFMPGIAEMRRLHNILLSLDTFSKNWLVNLLHSTFSTDDLERAFEIPPRGFRKIVIGTNIAETGITIPDVTAVIDTCKEKVMRFDERRQLSRLTEGFISRSSARQRRGRAARVQAGLCFHLVTRHRHDSQMLEQQVPEMLRLGLQDPMLRIKVWDLGGIEETLTQAIDPPSRKNILRAIEKLKDAGALTKNENLTPLGQQIARLPLEVSLAKLAIFGVIFGCLDPILAIVSLLTSKSPFLASNQADGPHLFSRGDSDLLSSLNAYESWRRSKIARLSQEFCRKNHISDQTMSQVEEQKVQLLVYLVDAGLVLLEPEEKAALNRARSGGGRGGNFYSVPERYNRTICDRALSAIIAIALYPRVITREGKSWRNVYSNQHVSLTPRSVNHRNPKAPRWLSFYEAMQSRSGSLNVFETTAIPESALTILLGEAEFKFFAGVVNLDSGKVRLGVRHWRQLMAIKILRERIWQVLEASYKRPAEATKEDSWKWIDFWLKLEAAQEG